MTKTILCVRKDKNSLETIKSFLEKKGYKVITTNNGKDCLKDFDTHPKIDLIILDIILPHTRGWKLYQKIKKKINKKNRKTKVMFLSEIPVTEERLKEFHKRGVSDYIVSPFDNDDLLKRIKTII